MDTVAQKNQLAEIRIALRAYDTQGLWRDDRWRELCAAERRILAQTAPRKDEV